MCVITEGAIFSGDTLFLGAAGAGRDDLPGGDPGSHWESLQKLLKLDDELIVYPGHEYRGLEPTSLGVQKIENPYLNKKSKSDFIYFIEDLKLGAADWMVDVVMANKSCTRDVNAAEVHDESPACEAHGTLGGDICDIDVPMISSDELQAKLKEGGDFVLIDVRDPEEQMDEQGRFEDSINIPIDHVYERIEEFKAMNHKEIILICRSDPRAYTAGQILLDEGLEKVFVLKGGLVEWNHHIAKLSFADPR